MNLVNSIVQIFPSSLDRPQFLVAIILSSIAVAIPANFIHPYVPSGGIVYYIFGFCLFGTLAIIYCILFAKRFQNAGKSPLYALPVAFAMISLFFVGIEKPFSGQVIEIIEKLSHSAFLIMLIAALAIPPQPRSNKANQKAE